MAEEEEKVLIGVLTVSDSCASGEATDTSGLSLTKLIEEGLIPNAEVSSQSLLSLSLQIIISIYCT